MVRRIASQVHKQVARLMGADYIKREPAWFKAVLDNPPLPLPPRTPPPRADVEDWAFKARTAKKMRPPPNQPMPIVYLEDDVRRQFFEDHPFEAFRPMHMVEGGSVEVEHPIRGKEWTRLSQRGRNPTSEDAVRFAVNLHRFHNMSLSNAYLTAVAQFRALRSEREVATTFAVMEAETYGAAFGKSEIERNFERESKHYRAGIDNHETQERTIAARKKWRAILDNQKSEMGEWARGEEYMKSWKAGIRPKYPMADLKKPDGAGIGLKESLDPDFMNMRRDLHMKP